MIEFNGYESARRRGSMSSEEIGPKWDKIFGKRLTWLDIKKMTEAWVR